VRYRVTFPDSFPNRYPNYRGFDEITDHDLERCFASWTRTLSDRIFPSLVSGYDAIKYAILNEVICKAHAHLCEDIGCPGLIKENSIRDHDRQNLVNAVFQSLEDSRVAPAIKLAFIEHIVQAALTKGNLGMIEAEWTEALNKPLRRAGLSIVFKERQFALVNDEIIEDEVDEPLWAALSKPGYETALEFLRRSLSERDTGGRDPALHAAKALESVLGRIVELKGIETKKNAGAAHLLDKICQAGLISDWERELFKAFFRDVRNPLSHGVPAGPIPNLTPAQTEWSIRFCMITIARLL
jgi:hypothetical protein